MKRALSQREVFLEISEFSPAAIATSADLPAIGLGHSQEEAATLLRSWLELDSLPKGIWARPRELLNVVVASMERKGILVVQTQGVAIAEMRGFSIAEQPYPVIALNGKDWPRPRLFTLIHELAHLSANLGGVCDLHERSRPRASADDVEHACNRIAAAVLIPRDRILTVPLVASADAEWRWTLDDLETLSQPFGCSSEAMLLRLITLGKADWETYRLRKPELERQYDEARQRERERQREADGGPNYYLVKARNLGHGYVATVLDAYQAKAISSLDAAVYLDVRFDQIPKLQRVVGR
jgi:Zn-dependent peptidase ImmA (M78 family)